jgi:hypothetical protein
MFAVSAPRCAAAPAARAASTLGSKRAIAAAPLRVHRARRASAVTLTARAAGTIQKVTKDELEKVMQVRAPSSADPRSPATSLSLSRAIYPKPRFFRGAKTRCSFDSRVRKRRA